MLIRPQDIIRRAMRLCGAIGVGRSMTPDEQADGLVVLNGVIDQFATERLTIYQEVRQVFSLVANQSSYTIGPGGNFNVPRPVFFPRASVITQTTAPPNQPLELAIQVITTQDWQTQVPVKAITSPLPLAVYYDYGDSAGLGTLTFYPVPTLSTLQVALYLPTPLAPFADATTQVDLAAGYADLVTFETAVAYAVEFGLECPPTVVAKAMEKRGKIKTANTRLEVLRCDKAIRSRRGGRYNWITDTGAGG